jgi:uncharacterized protein (TIGR02117 family)
VAHTDPEIAVPRRARTCDCRRTITVALLLTVLLHSACSGKPYAIARTEAQNEPITEKVYVVNHGWHTGFVISAEDITAKLPLLKERFVGARYLEFGWGEKEFYQAKEITAWMMVRAAMWPADTVVYVAALPRPPDVYYSNSEVMEVCVSNHAFDGLAAFLSNSFQRNAVGKIIPVGAENHGNSRFYEGEGQYSLLNTCNKWTAKGLISAGMDISPSFKLTARSVMDAIKSENDSLHCLLLPAK